MFRRAARGSEKQPVSAVHQAASHRLTDELDLEPLCLLCLWIDPDAWNLDLFIFIVNLIGLSITHKTSTHCAG